MSLSDYIRMFSDNPVLLALSALVLLMIVGPLVAGWISWRRGKRRAASGETPSAARLEQMPATRFLGTQMDLAILIVGLLGLVAIVGWIAKSLHGN
jgi:hypothetical protein